MKMKVTRVLEYEGNPEWIKGTLEKSIKGEIQVGENQLIRELSRKIEIEKEEPHE